MTNIGIDEVLNRLSVKFNRIFYDKDFVSCVSEDLQTIIKNENECCVLVFPTLSPNYLRVVRYQAKLCDLAVISLGSGSSKSVGVCHKKYFLPTFTEEELQKDDLTPIQMAENACSSTKKKRPPIQLYVPPAQRKSRLSAQKVREEKNVKPTTRTPTNTSQYALVAVENNRDDKTTDINSNKQNKLAETNNPKDIFCSPDDIDLFLPIPYLCYQCNCVKFNRIKHVLPNIKLYVCGINRKKKQTFYEISHQEINLVVWNRNVKYGILETSRNLSKNISSTRTSIFVWNTLDFREFPKLDEKCKINSQCLYGNEWFLYLPDCKPCYYQCVPDFPIYDAELNIEYYLNCSSPDEYIKDIANCIVLPQTSKPEEIDINSFLLDMNSTETPQLPLTTDLSNCDSKTNDACAKSERSCRSGTSPVNKRVSKQVQQVIVLDERIDEPPKVGSKAVPPTKDKSKQNEHEEEKEIMRKAKQNINRKTRPIMKYVDEDNDTLKIGKGDINNWEDLLNEDGELQHDIFTEIVQKVGPDVTIVKATEDYSAYASKQVAELEHMVELYDFPATLETHDIISAFSEMDSDSMYVKWVDDTHALLVLGSSTQAQRAVKLSNSLIKVRPMSAASKLALEKANQSDLKPAMKRPQTNLLTARRLITSHLGAKSRISKEQIAKEREDLRVAKELKKQARQKEKDAWEGTMWSTNQLA